MDAEQYFQFAMSHFYQTNYEQGLEYITQCIQEQPNNSIVRSNRALFYSQMGQIQKATHDLNQAIADNYLNYVAYFNLFSLEFRRGQELASFDNLCCSLSCLYLIKAQRTHKELDVQKSIRYAENNIEAHVLKSMMYLDSNKFKLALNQIDWAIDIKPKDNILKRIRQIIKIKINPDDYFEEDIQNDEEVQEPFFRLKSSYELSSSYGEEIKNKLAEFNLIYNELNEEHGTITQRVPRTLLEQERSINEGQKLSEIYQIKSHQREVDKNDKNEIGEAKTKEQLGEEEENQPEQELDEEEHLEQDISIEQFVDKKIAEKNEHITQMTVNTAHTEKMFSQEKGQGNMPSQGQGNMPGNMPSQGLSKMSSQSEQSGSIELYPIGKHKKIQFTIMKCELNSNLYKDIYCVGAYQNVSTMPLKIKTDIKRCSNNKTVQWYQVMLPTLISEQLAALQIKVYNKQYFSYYDDLIGEGYADVNKSGDIQVTIHQAHQQVATVFIKVHLI